MDGIARSVGMCIGGIMHRDQVQLEEVKEEAKSLREHVQTFSAFVALCVFGGLGSICSVMAQTIDYSSAGTAVSSNLATYITSFLPAIGVIVAMLVGLRAFISYMHHAGR